MVKTAPPLQPSRHRDHRGRRRRRLPGLGCRRRRGKGLRRLSRLLAARGRGGRHPPAGPARPRQTHGRARRCGTATAPVGAAAASARRCRPGSRAPSDWESSAAAKIEPSPMSPPTPTPTRASRSTTRLRMRYEEGGVMHVGHWCTIGGTSLASPLIASVFALAGGAGGVAYPAETLYENEARRPNSLHDVVSGSNGECTAAIQQRRWPSGCTELQEAASCSEKAICLARARLRRPHRGRHPERDRRLRAHQRRSQAEDRRKAAREEALRKEKQREEERQREEKKARRRRPKREKTSGTELRAARLDHGRLDHRRGQRLLRRTARPALLIRHDGAPRRPPPRSQPTIKLTAFALTPTALLALNRARPKVSNVGFAFTLSAAARVRASIAKLVRVQGREHWVLVPGSVTFAAVKGSQPTASTSNNGLTPGSYRLTLTPEHGSARSITFQIG